MGSLEMGVLGENQEGNSIFGPSPGPPLTLCLPPFALLALAAYLGFADLESFGVQCGLSNEDCFACQLVIGN
jgi:hypothetical protein